MRWKLLILFALGVAIGLASYVRAQQRAPQLNIVNIKGDLFRFQLGNGDRSVFLVTPEGIVIVDPTSTETATALKAELDRRYPGRPVRYVVYTHWHPDRISGGAVFAGTAKFVAHEYMPHSLAIGVSQVLPEASLDVNADGVLEPGSEARTELLSAFGRLDRNHDGLLTGPEMVADIYPPDTLYKDRMTITLGGKRVELVHPGVNHTRDMTVVLFPDERVLYSADLLDTRRLPGAWGVFDRVPLADWISSFKACEALDFDILVSAHTENGTKRDVSNHRQFFEDLGAAVSAGTAAGKSMRELMDTIVLDKYKDWVGYGPGGYQNADIFGFPVSPYERDHPRSGLRRHIQAAYLNLRAFAPVGSQFLVQQGAPRPQQGPQLNIVNVSGDLFRFQLGNGDRSVFLVTPEGILVVDPTSTEAATALKTELDRRYPGRPVRYVVYTHLDYGHISGGAVFAGTAKFVAHEYLPTGIALGVTQILAGGTVDANGDGVIESSIAEARSGTFSEFPRVDRNHDGLLTGPEEWAEVYPPDTFYKDRMTITLGGKRVELVHPGVNHTRDMTVVFFPEERVVYSSDLLYTKRTPGAWAMFDHVPAASWISSIKACEALDFDILVSPHTENGTKQDVVNLRQFWEDLVAAVSAGMQAGKSMRELMDTIVLDKYKDWSGYGPGGYNDDLFGYTITPYERDHPRSGLRRHIQAMYLNLRAYAPVSGGQRPASR